MSATTRRTAVRPGSPDGGSAWASAAACGLLVPLVPAALLAVGGDPSAWPLYLLVTAVPAFGVALPALELLRRWRRRRRGHLAGGWLLLAAAAVGLLVGTVGGWVFATPLRPDPLLTLAATLAAGLGGWVGRGLRRLLVAHASRRTQVRLALGSVGIVVLPLAVTLPAG